MLHLRPARPDEAELLTELCLRSKAVWGYDEAFMRTCRAELTLSPADFARSSLQVAVEGDAVTGVVQVVVDGENADLAKLFIAPSTIRAGVGRALFDWAAKVARERGSAAPAGCGSRQTRMRPRSTGAWAPSMMGLPRQAVSRDVFCPG
jgi:GNAT superfamily N-acetyltransferase